MQSSKPKSVAVLFINTTTELVFATFSYSDGDNKIKNAYTARAYSAILSRRFK